MNLIDFSTQKKIQGGDIREFEQLFLRYYEPLCRYACNILKDMDTAEDIVQDFFYHLWKNRNAFSPKLSLNAYLYHSIRNNALHYLEHMAVRQTYANHVFDEFDEKAPADILQEFEMEDLNGVIDATLMQLPERCSTIFKMNRFEGKKYHEISAILSVSVKKVEADMGKALQLFRKSLEAFMGKEVKTVKKLNILRK